MPGLRNGEKNQDLERHVKLLNIFSIYFLFENTQMVKSSSRMAYKAVEQS